MTLEDLLYVFGVNKPRRYQLTVVDGQWTRIYDSADNEDPYSFFSALLDRGVSVYSYLGANCHLIVLQ